MITIKFLSYMYLFALALRVTYSQQIQNATSATKRQLHTNNSKNESNNEMNNNMPHLPELLNGPNIPKVRKITKTDSGNNDKVVTLNKHMNSTSIKPEIILKKVSENVSIIINQPHNNNQTLLKGNTLREDDISQNINHTVRDENGNSTNANEIIKSKFNMLTTVNKSLIINSTTSTTTTTTTTITTPKPKKPLITYGVEDFPDLDKNLLQQKVTSHPSLASKLPEPEPPKAQPSQEFSGNTFQRGTYYIVPIVSMIFIIPLVMGILITAYRRFRDCWSTRHYRRMDFLVDGIYND